MSEINDLYFVYIFEIICRLSVPYCYLKFGKKIYMSGEVFYVVEIFQGRGLPILFRGVELRATAQDHSSFHLFMANN